MMWSDHTRSRTKIAAALLMIAMFIPFITMAQAITFSGDRNVMNDNREQDRVDVAAWGSGDTAEVYVVYEDYSSGPSNPHIFFQRSTNGGDSFSAPLDMLVDPDGDDKQLYPCIDVYDQGSSRTIAVGYLDNSPGDTSIEYYIMVTTSTDGGQLWSAPVKVTDEAHAGYPNNKMRNLDIAFDVNGNLFASWAESNRIKMAYSNNQGVSWSAPQMVKDHSNPENNGYTQRNPTVAADGDYVAIAWDTDVHFKDDVYLSRASTGSLSGLSPLSFENPQRMADPIVYPMYRTYLPRLVGGDGVLHIVWWDFSTDPNGNNNADRTVDRPSVKYTRSTNGGSTWGVGTNANVIVNTSDPVGWHSEPDMEIGPNGFIAVSWVDTTQGHPNVFASVSSNDGATWSTPARVNNYRPTSEKFPPRVAVDSSDTTHVVWINRNNPTTDRDVFHSRTIINQAPEAVQNLNKIFAEEYDAMIGWTFNDEPDFKQYNIYLDTTEGFTPGAENLYGSSTHQGQTLQNFTDLEPDTKYYTRVEVEDLEGLKALSNEISFATLPINQPPVFEREIPTIYMVEDVDLPNAINLSHWVEQGWVTDDEYNGQTELEFDIIASSPEPNLTALLRDRGLENPYWILDIRTNTPDWFGREEYRFKVTDAGKDGGFGTPDDRFSYSEPFDVKVNSTNDVPFWSTFQDINTGWQTVIGSTQTNLTLPAKDTGCIERLPYKFAIVGRDIDFDFISYTASDPRIDVTVDLLNPDKKSIFEITATNDDVPEMNFTITADDGRGGTREIRVFLPVKNVNDAPFFISANGTEVAGNEGTIEFSVVELGTLTFNVSAGDIDPNDSLNMRSLSEKASVRMVTDNNWTVTYTATEEDTLEGEFAFQLQLFDLEKTDLVFLNVVVDILNKQDQPNWISNQEKIAIMYTGDLLDENEWGKNNGGERIQAEWGEIVTFEAFAQDKDKDPLEYTWYITTLDGSKNWTYEGKTIEHSFEPSQGGLMNPTREKFKITVNVTDGITEPIQWFRELWVERDADNDNDGLPDAREIFFWGDLSHEPNDDEDSDGYTNIEEIGFRIPLYDTEIGTGRYSLNSNEINPTDPDVYPGQVKPVEDETEEEEQEDPLGIPPWLLATIIIVAIIIVLVVAGVFVIISISKKKEQKEEEDLEKRVQDMEKRQKEISGLYGGQKVGDIEGPDQSTLDDLKLDLGGQVYHEEGSKSLLSSSDVKKGKLEDEDKEKPKEGPAWESGTGPLFDDGGPKLEFGHSLEMEAVDDPDKLVEDVDDDALNESMDSLLNAADEYDEEAVKNAGGGNVLTGAVPMEEQIKQMRGQQEPGGPRVPPPGMEKQPQGMPPGQAPPKMEPAPVPKVGHPKVNKDQEDEK